MTVLSSYRSGFKVTTLLPSFSGTISSSLMSITASCLMNSLNKRKLTSGKISLVRHLSVNLSRHQKRYKVAVRWPMQLFCVLTHWGRVTHICVCNLTILGSGNGLSPGRRQAIIWTNDRILLIGPWGINLSRILIEINFHSRKCIWKFSLQNDVYFVLASMH